MQLETSIRRLIMAPIAVALLSSCASTPLRPATSKLAHWTTSLREQQPAESFAAIYRVGDRRIIFIGARHEERVDSPTFRMIADAYASFDIKHTIVEGVPTSRGPNPKAIIDYASREPRDGRLEGGELAAAVLGALKEGAQFQGGEPDDAELKDRLLAQGLKQEDLLGFYVLRSIPQWIRERKIKDAGDPRLRDLVEAELARSRSLLGLGSAIVPGYDVWARWYENLNGRPIGSAFVTEEVGPLYDGEFSSNKIAYAISRARGAHLHEQIITQLAASDTLLVVFGGSHLMIQRPALDAAVGRPCYTGSNLRDGAARCG